MNQTFKYIGRLKSEFLDDGLPVISIDAKKKELIEVAVSCLISIPEFRFGGVLCSLEYIACGSRTRYVLRILLGLRGPSILHSRPQTFLRQVR